MQDIVLTHLSQARVLVVEDDDAIRRFISRTLARFGAQIYEADSLQLARTAISSWRPNIVILDLGLPDGDGLDLIGEIRASRHIPIIVVSARDKETAKVDALLAGADDYLTKPFGTAELLARAEATLRRCATTDSEGSGLKTVTIGNCVVDFEKQVVFSGQSQVHLTKVEWALLAVLVKHHGKVLTHKQLLTEVWGINASSHTHYLRIYMQRLRAKIEPDPVRPQFLLTEIGLGYRLLTDEDKSLMESASAPEKTLTSK